MNVKIRSPLRYYGGKTYLRTFLLDLIPHHDIYIEVFGGGGSMLLGKKPSKLEVFNDLNEEVVSLFRVIRDPDKFAKLYHLMLLTPYSKSDYDLCRDLYKVTMDEIEKAYAYLVTNRMSFSGDVDTGWTYSRFSGEKLILKTSQWLSMIEMLPAIHERFMSVQIDNRDFRKIISVYDNDKTFMYLDPPYMQESRTGGKKYKHEMEDKDHVDLIEILTNMRGKWLLSGYRGTLYDKMLKEYVNKDFETPLWTTNPNTTGHTRKTRMETVWANYNFIEQGELFINPKERDMFGMAKDDYGKLLKEDK